MPNGLNFDRGTGSVGEGTFMIGRLSMGQLTGEAVDFDWERLKKDLIFSRMEKLSQDLGNGKNHIYLVYINLKVRRHQFKAVSIFYNRYLTFQALSASSSACPTTAAATAPTRSLRETHSDLWDTTRRANQSGTT